MDLVIWKLLRCLLNNYQIVTFDILAGEAGFEPTSTVLETAELPLFYSPVVITVYSDKSFTFEVKQPPVAISLKEAAKLQKGSGEPNRRKVASITWDQVKAIAEGKMPDLNAFTLASAMKMVAGTARSMGIKVTGKFPENL